MPVSVLYLGRKSHETYDQAQKRDQAVHTNFCTGCRGATTVNGQNQQVPFLYFSRIIAEQNICTLL